MTSVKIVSHSRRPWSMLVAFIVFLTAAACAHTSVNLGVSVQPDIPLRFSATFTVSPNGSISVSASAGIVTEIGVFSVDVGVETGVGEVNSQEASIQPEPDETILTIRHRVRNGTVDTVYSIATGEDVLVTVNGLTKIDVTNQKIFIDVSKGQLENITVKNAPPPPAPAQTQPSAPPGTVQLVRSITSDSVSIDTLAWSPDGSEIAGSGVTGDSSVPAEADIWRVSDGSVLLTHRAGGSDVYGITWAPDGQRVATSDSGCYCVQIWSAKTGQVSATVNVWANRAVSWSPDSRYLVGSGDGENPSVWNTYSGSQVNTYSGSYAWMNFPAVWSPHGESIVDGGEIWNGLTNQKVLTYAGLGPPGQLYFSDESWSPSGDRIASDGGDSLILWDADTGGTIWTQDNMPTQMDSPYSLSWSPNGKYIAWASEGEAGIVDASSGSLTARFDLPDDNLIYPDTIAWSPNGRYIATASNGAIQIWSAPS